MWYIKDRISDTEFIEICKTSISMRSAAFKLKLHFNSFKKRAEELGCYSPNPGLKGGKRGTLDKGKTLEILEGKYPEYNTYKLKNRLLNDGIKKNVCELCGLTEWNGKLLNMELHHKDGNSYNHKLENLMMLCPNCHSQTNTFRAKNKKLSASKEI